MSQISVIVPVYNVEKYVGNCIRSILAQTFRDFELIVVNDGTKDGSMQVVDDLAKEYPNTIKIIHQENAGLSAARNTGLKYASGKYIIFVDSDDTIAPEMFQMLYERAETYHSDLVMCAFESVNEKGERLSAIYETMLEADSAFTVKENRAVLLCQNAAWNKLYRRDLIEKYHLLFTPGVWYEDFRFTKKYLLYAQNIVYCDQLLYRYLIREGSIMTSMASKRNMEIVEAFEDVISYYSERNIYEEYKDEITFLAIQHIYIASLTRLVRAKQVKMAQAIEQKFLKLFPDYQKNPYIKHMDRNKKLVLFLLKHHWYAAIRILFDLKEKN